MYLQSLHLWIHSSCQCFDWMLMHYQTWNAVHRYISSRSYFMRNMCQFMKSSVWINWCTYKVFTIGDIPIANILIKWYCLREHVRLYRSNKQDNTLWAGICVNSWKVTFIYDAKHALTKLKPLDTSQLPISWLNTDVFLNIRSFVYN